VAFALAAVAFAPGLALGSFLNVVAARVPLRRSIVRPPSACMSCGQEIAWYDNVPLVSYVLLRGRCRRCHAGIPLVYPAVELVTGLLLAGCVLAFGLTVNGAVAAFFCAVLVAVSAIDLEHRIIPNRIVLPATVVVLAANTARDLSPEWAIAALAASGFLFAAALAYPAGMGMGDVKLALLMAQHRLTDPTRSKGAQDGNPVRPVPRDRFRRGPLLGPRDPARVLLDAALVLRAQGSPEATRGQPGR